MSKNYSCLLDVKVLKSWKKCGRPKSFTKNKKLRNLKAGPPPWAAPGTLHGGLGVSKNSLTQHTHTHTQSF